MDDINQRRQYEVECVSEVNSENLRAAKLKWPARLGVAIPEAAASSSSTVPAPLGG
jgi:hypothetical protein